METTFRHLFNPIKMGNVPIKNRIVHPTHVIFFSIDRYESPSEEQTAHYLAAHARSALDSSSAQAWEG